MEKQAIVGLLTVIVAAAALSAASWWLLERGERDTCGVCRREIHAQARAAIEVDGQRRWVCCARCALTMMRQLGKPVRLVQVTDYTSRRPLRPDDAFYVEGSRIILCEKHEPMLDATKHVYDRSFDRCEPSLYAFARRADAEEFTRQYGGVVRSLAELAQEIETRP